MNVERAKGWISQNLDLAVEVIRIYMGFAILAKGVLFIQRGSALMDDLQLRSLPYKSIFLVHLISITHLAGGLLLVFGLMTRGAALAQLPILMGAILFVHGGDGLFAPSEGMQFVVLVFFLLSVVTVSGGGRLSADYHLARRTLRGPLRATELHAH